MHNIEASGYLVIGGFARTVGDIREFVRLADQYGLSSEQPCNAAISCRVEALAADADRLGRVVLYPLTPGEATPSC